MAAIPNDYDFPKRDQLKIGERVVLRNHPIDGVLTITRLEDGVNIEETLDEKEECVYVNLREFFYACYLIAR